jgi:hypothetical protein
MRDAGDALQTLRDSRQQLSMVQEGSTGSKSAGAERRSQPLQKREIPGEAVFWYTELWALEL